MGIAVLTVRYPQVIDGVKVQAEADDIQLTAS